MRHLTDPANRVYMLTMEGLLFDLTFQSLKPTLVAHVVKEMGLEARPQFQGRMHGQSRVLIANNGFYAYGDEQAGLFEYDGKRFKRLSGKPHMDCAARLDMGQVFFLHRMDESSVLLWALVAGKWQRYRLPQGESRHAARVANGVDAHPRSRNRALPDRHPRNVL